MNIILRHKGLGSEKGQFLVELMVALSVLMTGLLAMLGLLSRSVGLNRVVSDNYIGTYLAAEGIEIVRNILDGNTVQMRPWSDGFADGCYEIQYDDKVLPAAFVAGDCTITTAIADPSIRSLGIDNGLYRYGAGSPTPFRRLARIELVGPGGYEIRVNSIVAWQRRGNDFQVNLEDYFFDWQL